MSNDDCDMSDERFRKITNTLKDAIKRSDGNFTVPRYELISRSSYKPAEVSEILYVLVQTGVLERFEASTGIVNYRIKKSHFMA